MIDIKKVYLHLHDKGEANWENDYFDFERLPVAGEYVAVKTDGEWYKVELVVHTPASESICADVYAVKVDHSKVKKEKLNTKKGSIEILK